MNSSLLTQAAGASLALFFSTVVYAGPGPQYWNSPKKPAAPAVEPAKQIVVATHLCAGAVVVPVTQMKPSWPNGRGPLVAVQVGTKAVCYMCPVTTVVTTNDWPNHRGPLTTTEVVKTGVEHTCTSCLAPVAKL